MTLKQFKEVVSKLGAVDPMFQVVDKGIGVNVSDWIIAAWCASSTVLLPFASLTHDWWRHASQTLFPLLNVSGTGRLTKAELVCGFLLIIDGSLEQKLEMLFHAFDKRGTGCIQRPAALRLIVTLLTMAYDRSVKNHEVQPLTDAEGKPTYDAVVVSRRAPTPAALLA